MPRHGLEAHVREGPAARHIDLREGREGLEGTGEAVRGEARRADDTERRQAHAGAGQEGRERRVAQGLRAHGETQQARALLRQRPHQVDVLRGVGGRGAAGRGGGMGRGQC